MYKDVAWAPAHLDKTPAVKHWSHLQTRKPTEEEIKNYPKTHAILIACGQGSGNLEVLDFDEKHDPTHTITKRWLKRLSFSPRQLGLPIIKTMSGGYHIYYRLPYLPDGNQKLAKNKQGEAVIETRGQGGYVIAPPHPSYRVLYNDLNNIPVITGEQHEEMFQAAVSLDEMPNIATFKNYGKPSANQGDRPGDHYDRQTKWLDILTPLGWHSPRDGKNGIIYLTRGGKKFGVSGALVTSKQGNQLFYCFTSSCPPFEPSTCYTKFGALTLLQYDGDFKKSAQEIYYKNLKQSLLCS
jgi:hypothetical protein